MQQSRRLQLSRYETVKRFERADPFKQVLAYRHIIICLFTVTIIGDIVIVLIRSTIKYSVEFRLITNLNTIINIIGCLAPQLFRAHIGSWPDIGHLQSVYRVMHSTETAMSKVVSDLLTIAGNKCAAMLLVLTLLPPPTLLTTGPFTS